MSNLINVHIALLLYVCICTDVLSFSIFIFLFHVLSLLVYMSLFVVLVDQPCQ